MSSTLNLLQYNHDIITTETLTDLSDRPYVTTYYQSDTSWYRIWSDGWIEQGGSGTTGSSSSGATLSYNTAFTTTNYDIVGNPNTNTSDQICFTSLGTSSCTAIGRGHGGSAFYNAFSFRWYACGL